MNNRLGDYDIYKIYISDPEKGYSIFRFKYSRQLDNYKRVAEFFGTGYLDRDFTDIIEDVYENRFRLLSESRKKEMFYAVGEVLDSKTDTIIKEAYHKSHKEIPYEDYKEYALKVVGKTYEELQEKQMDSFDYVDNPLTDERDQIYESLLMIDHYIMDENSNEIVFSPEQIGYINGTIQEIRDLLADYNLEEAKMKLVALQMMMGIDVRFYPTLKIIIEEDLSLLEVLNRDTILGNYHDDNRREGPAI